jgi:hypothetical protein
MHIYLPILQSWFSLFLFKLMLERVSQCMLTVVILYFGPFNPLYYSPWPHYLPPPIFQQPSIHILIFSTFTSYVMCYYWCSIILFFFLLVPQSSSTVTNVFCICVCIWSCLFFVYVYLWIHLLLMRENMGFCVSDTGLLHLTWCSPIASIYLQTTCHYSL